jgi:hypothetical protein
MHGDNSQQDGLEDLRRGDVVTVRSLGEILATLDADAKSDGMPFMPEMAQFCGMTFPVSRRAEKTCVEGFGIRSLQNSVFLDGLRCDGSAHGGCQRGCRFFWKEAWLRTVGSGQLAVGNGQLEGDSGQLAVGRGQLEIGSERDSLCVGRDLEAASQQSRRPYPPDLPPLPIRDVSQVPTTKGDRFYCQSTELAQATSDFLSGKWRCYLHDLRVDEITLGRFAYILWRALTNRVWRLMRGRAYYELTGEQKSTLAAELNLQPGEWVEVKSAAEIQATLDAKGRNRGLEFDPEMLLHCGHRYQVAAPLRNIIAEETGKMIQLSNTVLLEGLTCQGICALNCPRANYFYWREIWLKRV